MVIKELYCPDVTSTACFTGSLCGGEGITLSLNLISHPNLRHHVRLRRQCLGKQRAVANAHLCSRCQEHFLQIFSSVLERVCLKG